MSKLYKMWNGAMPTTAAPVAVTTGTAIKTMIQVKPAVPLAVVAWGVTMNQSAVATPGIWELLTTGTIFATVTAYAVADIMPFDDPNSANANTAGTSGVPLNLGTAASGYTSTSEGSIVATRMGDLQQIDPVNQYEKEFSLKREFAVGIGECLRVRCTLAAAVSALCWVLVEV